jgi:hypothetical protein
MLLNASSERQSSNQTSNAGFANIGPSGRVFTFDVCHTVQKLPGITTVKSVLAKLGISNGKSQNSSFDAFLGASRDYRVIGATS